MPNIMLTYRCNLNCTYCFANEFVNKNCADISLDNFHKAVQFLTTSGNRTIGLIGGEPTLHPDFKYILEKIIQDDRISNCILYTNGILLHQFVPQLTYRKFKILVNCNSPIIIGENAYSQIISSLDTLIKEYYMKNRITLGINLYSDDIDYSFIIELLQRYEMHNLRISLTVPNISADREQNPLDYFNKRKNFLMNFFCNLETIKVLPHYDCNVPPPCIWSDSELKYFKDVLEKNGINQSNLIGAQSQCSPVIDVLPNLQAVRCFGMSDFSKVSINDFDNISDLRNYFMNLIDANCYHTYASNKCMDCYYRKVGKCSQGCLSFQQFKLHAINAYIENREKELIDGYKD